MSVTSSCSNLMNYSFQYHKMEGYISVKQKEGSRTLMHLTLVFGAPTETQGNFPTDLADASTFPYG